MMLHDATWARERDDAYRRAQGLGLALLLLLAACAITVGGLLAWCVGSASHAG